MPAAKAGAAGRTGGGTPRGPLRADGRDSEPYDAGPWVPDSADLAELRAAAAGCEGCPLHREATGTVFGAGAAGARVMLVGEQPGDQEDRRGEPFVGPAGRVLARALDEAGVDSSWTYVTNAVKHFKFTRAERGRRRIHKAPSLRETAACRPWLEAETRAVRPEVVVALGATAGKALLGPSFRVTAQRGMVLPLPDPYQGRPRHEGGDRRQHDEGEDHEALDGIRVVATIHPSAVLRADDRDTVYRGLVRDLRVAAGALA